MKFLLCKDSDSYELVADSEPPCNIRGGIDEKLSGVLESAFLHNTSGGRVVDEEVRPQSKEALDIETVIDHRP